MTPENCTHLYDQYEQQVLDAAGYGARAQWNFAQMAINAANATRA